MAVQDSREIDILRTAYAAFNARDISAALEVMTPDVAWPRAFKGGMVRGHEEVSAYWSEQWSEISPRVEPVKFELLESGRYSVDVHQVVRNLEGDVISDGHVVHLFTMAHGLIESMEVGP